MLSSVRSPGVLEEFEHCPVAPLDPLGFSQPSCSVSSWDTSHKQSHRIIKVPKDLLISWSSALNLTLPQSSCTQLSSPAGLELMPCLGSSSALGVCLGLNRQGSAKEGRSPDMENANLSL